MHLSPWRFCFPLLAALSFSALTGSAFADKPTILESAKIPAKILDKALAGETQSLLVLFEDPDIETAIKSHLAQRGLDVEDDAALALRAGRYRQLKAPVLALLEPEEAELRRDYAHVPMSFVRFHGSAALLKLLSRNEVAAVYEDARLHAVLAQSLPLIGQPPVAQVMGQTGTGTTVAVLDTGVNYARGEFGSCTAPGVPAGCRVAVAFDTAPDDSALDDIGHGTSVSATVAATAPGTRLAVLDVFDGNGAYSSDIIAGIDWAIGNKSAYNIAAINMSLGDGVNNTSPCTLKSGPLGNPFRQPIIDARNAGILSVIASGNEGYADAISGPACTPEAISVGAVYDANVGGLSWTLYPVTGQTSCTDSTTAADKVSCFSNSAGFLTMLAPGALITVAGATVGGTSLSSPFVAGAVAVLKAAFPAETPDQTQSRLAAAGTSVTDSRNGIAKPRLALIATQSAPANDNFSAAANMAGDSGSAAGWNYNAGKESGEPGHAGDGGGKSVWWQWTATAGGTLTVDTHGSDFDTLLAVYTGGEVSALAAAASSDNDGTPGNVSGLDVAVQSGMTYRVAVDGKSGAAGAIALNWSFAPALPVSDLEITLTDSPDPVAAGSPLTYTLTVVNHGPDPAAGVVAILVLDAGTNFSSAGSECTASAGTVTCDLGSMANGEMHSLTVVAIPLAAGTAGASASVGSGTQNPVAGNDSISAQTLVEQASSSSGDDADVPLLPPWAMLLLGAALYGAFAPKRRPLNS